LTAPVALRDDGPVKSLFCAAAVFAVLLPSVNAASIYDIHVKDIDGRDVKLDAYRGKVLLIVNVASECGFTPQYEGLQALHEKYQSKGLVVLGFPCNQFGAQEPGTNTDIKAFCTTKFHVTFPMFEKIAVNGPDRHALYALLAGKGSPFAGNIKWNFGKFLVGRDGTVVGRFDSDVEPDAEELVQKVEAALARP
jgi:glutathione peroxidase